MIRGFEPPRPEESEQALHFQWAPAIAAGLVPGVILLILPHASPWEGLTLFTPAVMGRQLPASWGVPVLGVVVMHLAVSLIYGLLISVAVRHVRQLRAVLIGGIIGLLLFGLNLAFVSLCAPELRSNEVPVMVTHLVFGLITAGAYRGLLRRRVVAS